ncbi:MAG: winged helix-turn-helix domain-containing protein [Myxococcales bacterium]|nr:winged helix-turn-helix domain-containing protein [Myxococcales bacterium]
MGDAARIDLERARFHPPSGRWVRLTTREVALLAYLMERPGVSVSRSELLQHVWGYSDQVVTRVVDRTVARLRAKIEAHPAEPAHLVTVHGEGYRWVDRDAEIRQLDHPQPSEPVRLGSTEVDLTQHRVRRPDGTTTQLTAIEAQLLTELAASPGQVMDAQALGRRVWGHAPSTGALHSAVARLRRKLEHDPRHPQWLQTVRGSGIRLMVSQPPHGPAPPSTTYVDTGLVAALQQALHQHRLVTVLGPGGIGKTRALLELSHSSDIELHVVWCDLSDCADAAGIDSRLGAALGPGPGDLPHRLRRRGPALVLLDNAEHLVTEVRDRLQRWMAQAPEARFAVSSRTRLEHADEHVVRARPMTVEQAEQLLRDRAGDDATGPLGPLAEALDRLPLGLELAAAALAACTPAELCERLDDRLDLLAQAGRPQRHASLRDVLEHSWELLPLDLRHALARLSVFRGGFGLPAAESVLDGPALRWLRALEGHSLVHRRDGRFHLLHTPRLFAREKLEALGSTDARERHRAWCVRWAEARRDPSQPLGFAPTDAALHAELPNLLSCIDRPATSEVMATTLVGVLEGPLLEQRRLHTLDAVIRWGLDTTETPAARARMLLQRANGGYLGHEVQRARRDVQRVLQLVPDDARSAAKAWTCLTLMGIRQGRWSDATQAAHEAISAARETGHDAMIASALSNLAMVLRNTGDAEGARTALVEALPSAPDGPVRATILMNLGIANASLGQLDEAEAQGRAALSQLEEGVRLDLQGRCHGLVGEIRWLRGDGAAAERNLDRALALHQAEGAADAVALVLRRRARVHMDAGRLAQALEDAEAGLREVPTDSAPIRGALHVLRSAVLWSLGRASEAQADLAQARTLLGNSPAVLTLAEACDDRPVTLRTDTDHDAAAVFRLLG